MEHILDLLDAIRAELGTIRNSVVKSINELEAEKKRLDLIKTEQEARTIDLDKREIEIKKIEDVVELKRSAQELLDKAEKAAREVIESQRIFKENADEANKKNAEAQKQNEYVAMRNEKEAQALIKLREALETEKANYKIKIAKGILDQAERQ